MLTTSTTTTLTTHNPADGLADLATAVESCDYIPEALVMAYGTVAVRSAAAVQLAERSSLEAALRLWAAIESKNTGSLQRRECPVELHGSGRWEANDQGGDYAYLRRRWANPVELDPSVFEMWGICPEHLAQAAKIAEELSAGTWAPVDSVVGRFSRVTSLAFRRWVRKWQLRREIRRDWRLQWVEDPMLDEAVDNSTTTEGALGWIHSSPEGRRRERARIFSPHGEAIESFLGKHYPQWKTLSVDVMLAEFGSAGCDEDPVVRVPVHSAAAYLEYAGCLEGFALEMPDGSLKERPTFDEFRAAAKATEEYSLSLHHLQAPPQWNSEENYSEEWKKWCGEMSQEIRRHIRECSLVALALT